MKATVSVTISLPPGNERDSAIQFLENNLENLLGRGYILQLGSKSQVVIEPFVSSNTNPSPDGRQVAITILLADGPLASWGDLTRCQRQFTESIRQEFQQNPELPGEVEICVETLDRPVEPISERVPAKQLA